VAVSLAADPRGATVAVRDTGVGIEESALPHIFERFYRADPSRNRSEGGSGLGLSIAKWIVESHRAEIQAESEAGRGSVFRVRFPNGA
jgi:signal transduction histidine kinase